MATARKTPTTSPAAAEATVETVRVKEVERDPGDILRRAAKRPVRITAKDGTRVFHIATMRRGARSDPAWPASMPVSPAALKRSAGRILRLASGLQIALRVQAAATSAAVFFIEPGSEALEFTTQRLGGSIHGATLLRNALRRSLVARTAADAAAKQAESRRRGEVTSLQGRIATLERAAKKSAELSEALDEARKAASGKDAEIRALKSRIAALERAAKKPAASAEAKSAAGAESQSDLETSPAGVP